MHWDADMKTTEAAPRHALLARALPDPSLGRKGIRWLHCRGHVVRNRIRI